MDRTEELKARSEETRRRADRLRAGDLRRCVWDADAKDHGSHNMDRRGVCTDCPVVRCFECGAFTTDIEGHRLLDEAGHISDAPTHEVDHFRRLFDQVNRDSVQKVPYSDIDFYAEQILNIWEAQGTEEQRAKYIACELAKTAKPEADSPHFRNRSAAESAYNISMTSGHKETQPVTQSLGRVDCDICGQPMAYDEIYVADEEVLCRVCVCDCGAESQDPNDHGINCQVTQQDLDR